MLRRILLALLLAAAPSLGRAQSYGTSQFDTVVTPQLVLGGFTLTGVGTTSGTVAAGNDSRIVGSAQKAANLSDLASVSTARTNLGAAAAGTNSDIKSLMGLTTPLSGAQGGTGYASVSAALDGLFSSTQGAVLYRGASGWAALAPTTTGYVLATGGAGANPSWVQAAATTAVLYTPQSLTSAQQDQVRSNISGPVPAFDTASATLAIADIERPRYATNAITLTMPNGGAGWRTGPITDSNTLSGLVTLAVPSGATLDGFTNGTTVLKPYQKARIIQTGATAYVTDWVDRSPIVATVKVGTAAANVAALLPVGYPFFEFTVTAAMPSTGGGALIARLGSDGGSTYKSGASDYYFDVVAGTSGSSTTANFWGPQSYAELADSVQLNDLGVMVDGKITSGTATTRPHLSYKSVYYNNSGAYSVRNYGVNMSADMIANAIQFSFGGASIQPGAIIVIKASGG